MIKAIKGFLKDGEMSASQLNVWLESPKNYINWYIKGKPRPTSKYMEFGSFIHKAIEEGKSENPVLDMLISIIPRLEVPEKKLKITDKIGKTNITLNGILDSYDMEEGVLIDYKTGKAGTWSIDRVMDTFQFKFYAHLHQLFTKKKLKEIVVVHIHTMEDEEGTVVLTGDFDVYHYKPTPQDIKDVKYALKSFLEWTETLTEEMLSEEIPEDIANCIALMSMIKKDIASLEEKYDGFKTTVEAYMEQNGSLELKNDVAHLFYTTRKTWEYPQEIKNMEDGVKKSKKDFEKDHEPKTITKSLTFKLQEEK